MLYQERVVEGGTGSYYSLCLAAMKKRCDSWIIPCRILGISPAELVELFMKEYKAEIRYYAPAKLFSCRWDTEENAIRWCTYINAVAKEKNFQI